MRAVWGLLLLAASAATSADCERTNIPPQQGRPDLDGPGSFGPLQGTVTLACLRYIGYIEKDGVSIAIIEDETGLKHQIKLGDYIGENAGLVQEITPHTIKIRQIVKNSREEYVEAKNPVYLHRVEVK